MPTGSAVAQTAGQSASRDSAAPSPVAQGDAPYVKNWVFRSKKLKRCVFFEVQGSIAGSGATPTGPSSSDKDTLEWADIRLHNPPSRDRLADQRPWLRQHQEAGR